MLLYFFRQTATVEKCILRYLLVMLSCASTYVCCLFVNGDMFDVEKRERESKAAL